MSSIELEPHDLPDVAPSNHGRTIAGWVTTTGLVIATLLGSIGISIGAHGWTWTGVGVAIASLVAGVVLRALGYGQPRQQ
jgi:hypothetical protein